MKTILLITVCCFACSPLFAQPVITSASAPEVGDNFVVQSAGIVDFEPGNSGADLIWDFSLAQPDTVTGFAFEYVNPAGLPKADSFPDANLALAIASATSVANSFFKVDANGIELLGNALTDVSITTYSDPRLQVVFPFTYQSGFVDPFSSITNVAGLMTTEEGIDSVFADAYGTLILPDRTNGRSVERFENVLRVRVITNQIQRISIGGILTETELRIVSYNWVSPDYTTGLAVHLTSSGESRAFLMPGGAPIVTPLPVVTTFAWNEQGSISPVYRVNPTELLDVKWLSSQPVRDEIQISVSSPYTDLLKWGIFDVGGRMITSGEVPLVQNETKLTIPYTDPTGFYFIRFDTEKGLQKTIKFIKQ